ncbi:MAG TPA: hypothetical protein VGC76_00510 [Pyrinomonadaceae bacterium]|jgi:hypothetical protein
MKLWKKIALILLGILLLIQIPFIYRRFQIKNLAEKINSLNAQRKQIENPDFKEYKGIIHAHTFLGGHSTGSFEELIAGANADNLDFVLMTEHTTDVYDSSALTLNGVYGNTLFVGGHEANTSSGDRFLLIPGSAESFQDARMETAQFLEKYHAQNKLALVTYPEKFQTWDANFDGIEVFSLHTNAKKASVFCALFDLIWSYSAYPDATLADYLQRPSENLQKFDEIAAGRRITLSAGSDAHSNIGFHLLGDDAGNKIINLKIDRYWIIFRLVRQHVLLEKDKPLTRENLLDAIKKGHSFVGFDVLSDTDGFSFTATNGAENKIQGDEIALGEGVKLKASAPQTARFVVFKNGEKVFENGDGSEITFDARTRGAYRVEVYLDSLGRNFDKTPWIISNPIYVK